MANRPKGHIQSPPDSRDKPIEHLIGAAASSPTEYFELLRYLDFINDQLSTESCVLNAMQQLQYVLQGVQGVQNRKPFSRLFGYYNSRAKHGVETVDMGTIPRCAWQALSGLGFCHEALWPFDESKVNQKPAPETYTDAFDQKWMDGYYVIYQQGDDRVAAIQQALSQNNPIVLASQVGTAYEEYTNGDLGIPTDVKGSHMTCGVAYDATGLWIVNSWNQFWGNVPKFLRDVKPGKFNGGFGHMTWDFVKWLGVSDIWAASISPQFLV
jgi:hypothetical protein